MKRLIYISHATRTFTAQEIEAIGEVSAHNNQRNEITGVLLFIQGIFFQILEGKPKDIDVVYGKILKDPRHNEILCLKAEEHLKTRMFPEWSMRVINFEEAYSNDVLFYPIKTLLQTLTESFTILERYTPQSVINQINKGINPLRTPTHIADKIIFFSDIFAFSSLTEHLPVSDVVAMVNHYLSLVTEIVTAHQGEVYKFIGDSVMAAFEADQADQALHAAMEILEVLNLSRQKNRDQPLGILYAGIGLSYGSVIEGNVGSPLKMDYTLLGDAVNTAARLESLTRQFPYALLFSREVQQRCQTAPWDIVDLGMHSIKGRSKSVAICSINHPIVKITASAQELYSLIQHELEKLSR
ncbi:MAG: BLUF domain-containing protein [Thiotrichaceae bacterium]|nr:BLUF domain-containing protein [Thiotrichaceae bacterium]